jgi:hypothetical protein
LDRGDEGVAEHVRMDLRSHACGLRQAPQTAGSSMAVHPGATAVQQDRPVISQARGPVDDPADR